MLSFLCRALRAERHELPALGWAFAYFFMLLAGYYVLRPVRDEMGVQAGTAALPWLFSATFAAMLLLVPLYGWLCAQLPRARLLPVVYAFFALNLAAFWAALESGVPAKTLAPVFFVWVSVFNLFVVAVFWSLMADIFTRVQAGRLFAGHLQDLADAVGEVVTVHSSPSPFPGARPRRPTSASSTRRT